MTTLSDIRDRVRADLRDLDATNERWDDDQLDRHIAHALADLSLAAPLERTATVATTPGSRELATSALTGFMGLEAVEFPEGRYPPAYAGFSIWDGSITLHVEQLPDGGDAVLRYLARHTLDGSGSTLPEELEDVLVTGAAGYAAIEFAAYAFDRLHTGNDVPARYRAWGEARLTAFERALRRRGRERALRGRRLFTPA